ncbi:MAG: hypothetical protein M1817_002801 [Caeruleum heppii]|nr:MAG: hypothetical protein M1817_002801 [Caeruleum heppii]
MSDLTPEVQANLQYQLANIKDDRGPEIIAINIVLITLTIAAVAIRIAARKIVKVPLSWDDYVILFSMTMAIGLVINNFFLVHYGMGQHAAAIGIDGVVRYLRGLFGYYILYILCLPSAKLSILLFYYRIFPTQHFRRAAYVVGGFIVFWCVGTIFASVFECKPVSYFWNQAIPGTEGKCVNVNIYYLLSGLITIITDVIILILPMPVVWKLQIPKSQKFALTGIFVLGFFCVVASAVRIPLVWTVLTTDPTWTSVNASNWTLTENCVAIICACLPIMRPVFRKVLGEHFSFRSWGSSKKQSSSALSSASTKVSWPSGRSHHEKSSSQGVLRSDSHPDPTGLDGFKRLNESAVATNAAWPYDRPGSQERSIDQESDLQTPKVVNQVRAGRGEDSMDRADLEQGLPLNVINVRREMEWSQATGKA